MEESKITNSREAGRVHGLGVYCGSKDRVVRWNLLAESSPAVQLLPSLRSIGKHELEPPVKGALKTRVDTDACKHTDTHACVCQQAHACGDGHIHVCAHTHVVCAHMHVCMETDGHRNTLTQCYCPS